MSAIAWQPYYSVGEPSLDAQHQQIIGIVNDLYDALEEGHDPAALKALLDRLVRYTDVHFKHEEQIMQEHDYPGLAEHRILHAQLRKRTVDFREYMSLITARDLLNFLRSWWMAHIRNADQQYAPYMELSVRS